MSVKAFELSPAVERVFSVGDKSVTKVSKAVRADQLSNLLSDNKVLRVEGGVDNNAMTMSSSCQNLLWVAAHRC